MKWLCYVVFMTGATSAFAAAGWVKTVDGREWMGELEITNHQFVLSRSNREPVSVALTNLLHGRFNLTNLAATLLQRVSGRINPSLPAPWEATDVGDVGIGGNVSVDRNEFLLEGAGDSFASKEPDAFFFVHQPLRGDGEIVARILNLDSGAAGIMIRDGLGSNAPIAAVFAQPRDVVSYRDRPDAKRPAKSGSLDRPYVNLPRWVRLKREGDTIKGYFSWDNGEHWEKLMNNSVAMSSEVRIGLFMTSKGRTSSGRARFDRVSVSQFTDAEAKNNRRPVYSVVLRTGSVITGKILSADETVVKLLRQGKTLAISTPNVARLLFEQSGDPVGGGLIPKRPGVLLERGDFIDGDLTRLENDQVKVSSVLFGFRTFRAGTQVKAVALRDLDPGAPRCVVKTFDGSIWRATDARIENSELQMQIPELGRVGIPWVEVAEVTRP